MIFAHTHLQISTSLRTIWSTKPTSMSMFGHLVFYYFGMVCWHVRGLQIIFATCFPFESWCVKKTSAQINKCCNICKKKIYIYSYMYSTAVPIKTFGGRYNILEIPPKLCLSYPSLFDHHYDWSVCLGHLPFFSFYGYDE